MSPSATPMRKPRTIFSPADPPLMSSMTRSRRLTLPGSVTMGGGGVGLQGGAVVVGGGGIGNGMPEGENGEPPLMVARAVGDVEEGQSRKSFPPEPERRGRSRVVVNDGFWRLTCVLRRDGQ